MLQETESALGLGHADLARILNNWGVFTAMEGSPAEAQPLLQRAADIRVRTLGPDHALTLSTRYNLAALSRRMGDHAAAESIWRETLAREEKSLGSEHVAVARRLQCRGVVLVDLRRFEEADACLHRALRIERRVLDSPNELTAMTLNTLVTLFLLAGTHERIKPLIHDLFEHKITDESLRSAARCFAKLPERAEAESFLTTALDRLGPLRVRSIAEIYEEMGLAQIAADFKKRLDAECPDLQPLTLSSHALAQIRADFIEAVRPAEGPDSRPDRPT